MRDILVFSCTLGPKEATHLFRSLHRLGIDQFEFAENNRGGLAKRYNDFLDTHAGKNAIGVLVHDDVSLEDAFVCDKLSEGAKLFAIQGLAGAASFDLQLDWPETIWIRAPRAHLSGAIEHTMPDGLAFWNPFGPVPKQCIVLDGLFFAVDLAKIGNVRFDERFAFNFYDLDFCLSAHRAGLSLGTVNVHAHHHSRGEFGGPAFLEAQTCFREKWMRLL